ncbi:MAG: DUF1549 and DUF1553 domain-containing protein, partial [Fimbriiglobus sp.]|nr:DUF1549 and DUF1553 domain-containing protein [Fimbriiglobus sp.]
WAIVAGLAVVPAWAADPATAVTAAIDTHLAADWQARKITPAPRADDEEFCRRVYLDVLGRIPKVAEVRGFADDPAADKRAKLVDTLLSKPGYAANMAAHLRAAWLPETVSDQFKVFLGNQYEEYLKRKLRTNEPLDRIVRQTLTAEVAAGARGRTAFANNQPQDPDLLAVQNFYQALEAKPENLGATTSRAFLGFKLECAQCHDHPFAPYTRTQFWQFAAFFAEFTPLPPTGPSFVGPLEAQHDKNRLAIPGQNRQVSARFTDGTSPKWADTRTPRQELADWILDRNNPAFARNMVNRVWQAYFGVGLLDPIDEPGDANPPSHPTLLDDLAAAFADSGYDLKSLIRGLTASRAYQLTSRQTHESQADPRRFARMNLKGLSGGQIYDSFVVATGLRNSPGVEQAYYDPGNGGVSKFAFRTLFPIPQKPIDTQTSILQALTVMNGKLVVDQTSVANGEILGAIADAPFLDTAGKVEALFYAALTRKPTTDEREKFTSYVERGGPSGDKSKALADVFWVLLNSTEFLFNH